MRSNVEKDASMRIGAQQAKKKSNKKRSSLFAEQDECVSRGDERE